MPANRRRSAITAPYDRWVLLGSRLELRRRSLGYTWRTGFEERGVNKRLAADIEKAAKDRVDKFMPGSMQLIAQGYAVAYESVVALLRGETDDLVPVPVAPVNPDLVPVPPAVPASRPLPGAPMDDGDRESAVRPYATRIWDALLHLAGQGITSPTGVMLGLDPGDAKVWDGSAGAMSLADRAWLVADIQRRRDARASAARSSATTA